MASWRRIPFLKLNLREELYSRLQHVPYDRKYNFWYAIWIILGPYMIHIILKILFCVDKRKGFFCSVLNFLMSFTAAFSTYSSKQTNKYFENWCRSFFDQRIIQITQEYVLVWLTLATYLWFCSSKTGVNRVEKVTETNLDRTLVFPILKLEHF